MNRQRLFSFNIQTTLLITLFLAIFVPLSILGQLTFSSANDLALNNLEAYIRESGARQQAAIGNDFRTALAEITRFLDASNNRSLLVEPLQIRLDQGTAGVESERLEDDVAELFRDELIDTGYFNSVWLLTPIQRNSLTGQLEADTLGTVTAPGQSLPFNRVLQNESTSEISQVGRALRLESGDDGIAQDTQALVVTQRESEQHVEVINLLYSVSNNQSRFVGYLVADLNLDRIILNNIDNRGGEFEPYSYIILPNERDVIAFPDIINEGLIDLNSLGAQRIIARQASNVALYNVGDTQNRREVLGYYAPITIEGSRFSLVTEIDTSLVRQQLFSYIATISFPILITSVVLLFSLFLLLSQFFLPPLEQLREAMRSVMRGDFEVPLPAQNRADELGQVSLAFAEMRKQVQDLTADMERRLRVRTRDVRVTQDIARTVTAERDLNTLMTQVVNLIVANFPLIYHAQIFLIDEARQDAILRASTGEAGRQLLQRRHKLPVGSVSVIGQVTEQGQVIIARDTQDSDVHQRNELLQETRAELAIPMQLGGEIIGALDVQSKQSDSFDEDLVTALQTLADQITIAIENARLFERTNQLLRDVDRQRRADTRQSWQQYMYNRRQSDVVIQSGIDTGNKFDDLIAQVYSTGEPQVGEKTRRDTIPFVVPINLRGEILGVAEYEVSEDDFAYDKVLLAEELVNRLALSLDNARLFSESQEVATRERIVNNISTEITSQTDVESILETAIREVSIALRTDRVAIRLDKRGNSSQDKSNKGTNGYQNDKKS